MVGIGWFAAADEAGLRGDEPKMLSVAIAPRLSDREGTLVDARRPDVFGQIFWTRLRRCDDLIFDLIAARRLLDGVGLGELRQFAFEGFLDSLGVGGGQAVLGRKDLLGPACGLIGRRDAGDLAQEPFPQDRRLVRSQNDGRAGALRPGTPGMPVARPARQWLVHATMPCGVRGPCPIGRPR